MISRISFLIKGSPPVSLTLVTLPPKTVPLEIRVMVC
jgi:hypothetical protein